MENKDRDAYLHEQDEKRRGQRPDLRRQGSGRLVKAASQTNRRQRRAYEKLMRSDTSAGAKIRKKVQEQIEQKSTEVRQRIADGESLDSIREDLKQR